MRITGITSRVLEYDKRERYGDGPVPAETRFHISFDVIHTDEGIDGFTMQYGGLGDGRAIAHALHGAYAGDLIGRDPRYVEAIWQDLRRKNRHMYSLSDAIVGAIDVALWDLRGKMMGEPIGVLLGLARERIPAYATARAMDPTPEQIFAEAESRKREGFHAFKVQVWDGLERDEPRFRAAREAVGPTFPLMQDAGGGYSYIEALAVGRVLEELNYFWFEEPIPDRQIGQLRRLSDALHIPILAMETIRLHEMPEYLRQGVADLARGDVLIKSGITGLRKACATAELFGYNLELHGLGPILLDVAGLHVALSIENCSFVESHDPLYQHGVVDPPQVVDGYKHLPKGPGLGVEVDWGWVEDHTVEIIRSGQST